MALGISNAQLFMELLKAGIRANDIGLAQLAPSPDGQPLEGDHFEDIGRSKGTAKDVQATPSGRLSLIKPKGH